MQVLKSGAETPIGESRAYGNFLDRHNPRDGFSAVGDREGLGGRTAYVVPRAVVKFADGNGFHGECVQCDTMAPHGKFIPGTLAVDVHEEGDGYFAPFVADGVRDVGAVSGGL